MCLPATVSLLVEMIFCADIQGNGRTSVLHGGGDVVQDKVQRKGLQAAITCGLARKFPFYACIHFEMDTNN